MGTSTVSYRGEVAWVSEPEEMGRLLRAVFRTPSQLVLEIESQGKTYVVDLRPASSSTSTRWRGSITRADGGGGTCTARLFRGDGELFLFGEWRENNAVWNWWIELEPEDADG